MADPLPAESLPKRRSGWRIFGLVVLSLFLLTGASCLMVSCLGNSRMREIEKETPRLIAEVVARNPKRPVLYGESTPGRAWEEYDAALADIKAFTKDTKRGSDRTLLSKYADAPTTADREAAAKLVAEFGPALQRLKAGAHRENGMISLDWNRGAFMDIPGLLGTQNLANLAVARARLLALEGRHRESLDCLSDTMTFARDLSYNGVLITHMIGIAMYGIAVAGLRDITGAADFPATEFPEVARRLEIVDASYPASGWSFENDNLSMRVTLQELWHGKNVDGVPAVTGLFGGSFLIANAITRLDDHAHRIATLSGKKWADVMAESPVVEKETVSTWNPIVRIAAPGLFAAHRSVVDRLAHIRMLRAFVGWRITGKVPELADPYGDLIHASFTTTPRFWSNGRNGVDDGGKGDWRGNGADLVLER